MVNILMPKFVNLLNQQYNKKNILKVCCVFMANDCRFLTATLLMIAFPAPCRPPRRRPRPDTGQKPQSSVKKEKRMPPGGDARAPGRSRQPAEKKTKGAGDHAPMLGSSHPTEETCLCPVVSLRNEKVNRSPRATRTPQKIPYAQRAGREGDHARMPGKSHNPGKKEKRKRGTPRRTPPLSSRERPRSTRPSYSPPAY